MRVYRIYVEREETRSVKLYVTNIESRDQGRYKCLRMQGGARREEKSVSLTIFSERDNFSVPDMTITGLSATSDGRLVV